MLIVIGVLGIQNTARAECRFLLDCDESTPQKPGPGPSATRTYTIYNATDFDGDDIRWINNRDLGGCRDACTEDANCRAFTLNRPKKVCILKYGTGRMKSDPDAVSGSTITVSAPAPAPSPSPSGRIRITHGIDYPGGDLEDRRGVSIDRCAAMCVDNSSCRGFSYVRSKSWCWLKYQVFSTSANADVSSGTK